MTLLIDCCLFVSALILLPDNHWKMIDKKIVGVMFQCTGNWIPSEKMLSWLNLSWTRSRAHLILRAFRVQIKFRIQLHSAKEIRFWSSHFVVGMALFIWHSNAEFYILRGGCGIGGVILCELGLKAAPGKQETCSRRTQRSVAASNARPSWHELDDSFS